jgi:hypothetical protein
MATFANVASATSASPERSSGCWRSIFGYSRGSSPLSRSLRRCRKIPRGMSSRPSTNTKGRIRKSTMPAYGWTGCACSDSTSQKPIIVTAEAVVITAPAVEMRFLPRKKTRLRNDRVRPSGSAMVKGFCDHVPPGASPP